MGFMNKRCSYWPGAGAVALWAVAAAHSLAQDAPTPVPLNTETVIGDLAVGCSGVGQQKAEPRWLTYPIRVEFSNPGQEYLSDGAVSVSDSKGRELASVSCEGPWILLRPATPGGYSVKGWLTDVKTKPQSGAFHIPYKGQMRMVLVFPDAPAS